MHALVQDRHNPDVAIREMTPVDEMAFVAKEKPSTPNSAGMGFEATRWAEILSKAANRPVIYFSA